MDKIPVGEKEESEGEEKREKGLPFTLDLFPSFSVSNSVSLSLSSFLCLNYSLFPLTHSARKGGRGITKRNEKESETQREGEALENYLSLTHFLTVALPLSFSLSVPSLYLSFFSLSFSLSSLCFGVQFFSHLCIRSFIIVCCSLKQNRLSLEIDLSQSLSFRYYTKRFHNFSIFWILMHMQTQDLTDTYLFFTGL